MTVTLIHEKIMNLKDLIQQALASANSIKIPSIAQIIGHMIASLPAVQYGALYYRQLEIKHRPSKIVEAILTH